MRSVRAEQVAEAVARLYREAACSPDPGLEAALRAGREREESPAGKSVLDDLLENLSLSRQSGAPPCQDTGTAVVFLELGQDLRIEGGDLSEAVDEGVRQAVREGYLRPSIVADPLRRENTGDNTPAVLHLEIVPGERLTIAVAAKGAGSENMSTVKMLIPAAGEEEIIEFAAAQVEKAGANPCPPVVVGIGLGGNFETAPLLAKKAITLPLGERHPDPFYATLEEKVIERVNRTGVGPGGLGGRFTCLDCHVLARPCHIASLPLAVNLDCCLPRHQTTNL
jgi:fumarate hydratase subunit alpha